AAASSWPGSAGLSENQWRRKKTRQHCRLVLIEMARSRASEENKEEEPKESPSESYDVKPFGCLSAQRGIRMLRAKAHASTKAKPAQIPHCSLQTVGHVHAGAGPEDSPRDRKSTRLNSSHQINSYP